MLTLVSHVLLIPYCARLLHRQAGQVELAERLVECQYELTDRLAFYLCGRRPGKLSAALLRVVDDLSLDKPLLRGSYPGLE